MKVFPIKSANKRTCGSCTKCCDGWLWGSAHGHHFWAGRKCHFVSENGCSIYKDRPDDPCKSFQCMWLNDERIPEWMKPNLINAIFVNRHHNGHDFIEVSEAGSRLDSSVLSWLFIEYANGRLSNIKYQLDSGWVMIGSNEFIDASRS